MSYLVLARKWRPQSFEDVTGQEHVVQTLANAIAQGRVAHAFLLCGPRGVGKTTTARLLARALNCEEGPTATPCGNCVPCKEIAAGTSVDVAEIDGASNNGVESVRELRESARYLPQRDRHKVFIIDEVHMLTTAAFNALLKILEEPPAHVKFIFATTDPQKLPETILSRVQRHNFRRVPQSRIVERLRRIAEAEGLRISDHALGLLARQADGGMRDALSLLDQLISSVGMEIDDVAAAEALGLVDRTVVQGIASALIDRDGKRLVESLAAVFDRGIEPRRLCEELALYLRDLIYVQAIGEAPAGRADSAAKELLDQAQKADPAQLARLFDRVHGAIRELASAAQPRLALEVALLSALHLAPAQSVANLAARLDAVAASLGGGGARGSGGGPGPRGGGRGGGGGGFGHAPEPPPGNRPPSGRGGYRASQGGGAPGGSASAGGGGDALAEAFMGSAEDVQRQLEAMSRAKREQGRGPEQPAGGGTPRPPNEAPGQQQEARAQRPLQEAPSYQPPPYEPPSFDEAPGRVFAPEASPGGCASGECLPEADAGSEAATPSSAARPSSASGRGSRDDPTLDLHERWRRALQGLKSSDPVTYGVLAEGRLAWLRQGEVALGFGEANRFHRISLERDELRDAAETFLSEWFGTPTRLRIQDAAENAPASVADESREEAAQRKARLEREAREHPAVLATLSVLGGEIEEIHVLEGE